MTDNKHLSDSDLIIACTKWIEGLTEDGDDFWLLRAPAGVDHDPDVLFRELVRRHILSQQALEEKEAEVKEWQTLYYRLKELYDNTKTNHQ